MISKNTIGIIGGIVLVIILVLVAIFWRGCDEVTPVTRCPRGHINIELVGLSLLTDTNNQTLRIAQYYCLQCNYRWAVTNVLK